MNGTQPDRLAPSQEQQACQQDMYIPYKVKHRGKFCEMLWLAKLTLFSQVLAIFSTFFSLETLLKMKV